MKKLFSVSCVLLISKYLLLATVILSFTGCEPWDNKTDEKYDSYYNDGWIWIRKRFITYGYEEPGNENRQALLPLTINDEEEVSGSEYFIDNLISEYMNNPKCFDKKIVTQQSSYKEFVYKEKYYDPFANANIIKSASYSYAKRRYYGNYYNTIIYDSIFYLDDK